MSEEDFMVALERLMASRRPSGRGRAVAAALAGLGEPEVAPTVRLAMEMLHPNAYGRLRVRWGDPALAPTDRVI